MIDRDYYFWIATFTRETSESIDAVATVESMLARATRSSPHVSFSGFEIYRDVGNVAFETTTHEAVRDWEYCLLAELDVTTQLEGLLTDPPEAFTSRTWGSNVRCLSSEIASRPKAAGTPLPRQLPNGSAFPENFKVGIEYIDIPDPFWMAYKAFMRDNFGPVGSWLIEHGHSHKIIDTERVRSFFHDPSLPRWNRIHFLTGDFDDERGGFIERTAEAVRSIIGAEQSVATAMASIRPYRKKPKMSKNEIVHSTWPQR